jgi:hypothetical protein
MSALGLGWSRLPQWLLASHCVCAAPHPEATLALFIRWPSWLSLARLGRYRWHAVNKRLTLGRAWSSRFHPEICCTAATSGLVGIAALLVPGWNTPRSAPS